MAFALDPSRPVPESVKAAAEEQLRKTVEALTGQTDLGLDEAAHDARKRTKKVRALLRLVRRDLGEKVYRRENRALRDAARRLSPVRDAWVLVEALDDLASPPDGELSPETVTPLRALLTRDHRMLQEDVDGGDTPAAAAMAFEAVLARVSRWPLPDRGWAGLATGLETVARAGRDAMETARSRGRATDFHEWRKEVKYLRHQFELVQEAWPGVLGAMADAAADLGELLGADHDLAVLRDRVEAEAALAPATQGALLARIDGRRKDLQGRAIALGRTLYAENPSALTQRLGRLWRSAA